MLGSGTGFTPQELAPSKILGKPMLNGRHMPVLGFGTWKIGGKHQPDPTIKTEAEVTLLRSTIAQGVRLIDTAEKYANGWTEELIGLAIQPYPRQELFLTSKVHRRNMQPENLRRSCEQSLQRLKTDYLDLYLLHTPCEDVPLEQIMAAMDKLVDDGLVRAIGVSNFSLERLMRAQGFAQHPVVCNQVHYSLATREAERSGLLGYCQENDVILQAYGSVDTRRLVEEVPPVLAEIAKRYGKTPNQVSINWLIQQPSVTALMMTRAPAHLRENLGGCDWAISEEEIERLRVEFPDQTDKSPIKALG